MRWTGLLSLLILAAACTETAGNRTTLKGTPRGDDDDDDDNITAAVDAGGTPSTDAAPADGGPTTSSTCNIGGLALCLAFENNLTDESANGLKGKSANIEFVAGKAGQAASFGTGSSMTFEPSQVFELPADAATLEAWVKRQSTGKDAVVFDNDGRFSLTITANGKVLCQSSGGAVTGATDVPVETWTHVACVIDKGELRAYVAGKEDAKGAGAIAPNPTLGAALGQNSPDGQPFVGLIDSFRLMWVARTAAEIAADAAQ